MKLIVSSDYHLRLSDKWGFVHNGINTRLQDRINTLTDLVNYAIENKANAFVMLGDIFDKINPPEKLRRIFVDVVVAPLLKKDIPLVFLMGNHDTNYDIVSFETETALVDSIYAGMITFVKEPTILEFGDWKSYFLPYGFEPPKENYGCDICFAHHGIKGAETGVGVIQRGGEEHDLLEFSIFKFIFSGHYHKPQTLSKSYDSSFIYVGSTNRWDMGERLDDKRFLELTKVEESDNSLSLNIKSIPLNDRKFIRFVVNEGESYEIVEDIKDCAVSVIFRGSKQWFQSLDKLKIKQSFESQFPHIVKFDREILDSEIKMKIDMDSEDFSEEKVISKYFEDKNVPEYYLEEGLKVFSSVDEDKKT
jgi:DNA repair exonuclease SbcCD nuclease subunit